MRMSTKVLPKSKSAPREGNNSGSELEPDQQQHLSQADGDDGGPNLHNPSEADLFSFLSAMHLSGGAGGNGAGPMHPAAAQVLASRKRKFLDQSGGAHVGSGSGSGKLFGGMRPPTHRGNSDEEAPLHTPQCSQSGKTTAAQCTVVGRNPNAFGSQTDTYVPFSNSSVFSICPKSE